ncbi:MAG: glycosyltransferase [Methylovirgula sp.]
MDMVLIANGLTNRGEHSYRLIQEVRGALARRAIGCHVFAARCLDPDVVAEKIATPHFKHTLYDSVGPRASDAVTQKLARWPSGQKLLSYPAEFLTWKMLNRSFRRDLESLPQNICTANNLVVITAVCQNQIAGLVDFMRGRPRASLPRIVCQLMFPPHWTPWERSACYSDAYYRRAFQSALPFVGDRLFFTTENEAVAKIYREHYGIDAKILPVPLAVSRSTRLAEKTVRLGFFGYSKSAKGFHLLPDVATICRDAGLPVEFHIQIQHSHWEPATIDAEARLRSMPNVHLLEGTLHSSEYIAETNKVDVALLPYDPVLFGMRGSGVFTESVAAGRPIIASDGTYAAESIRMGVAQGEIFKPYGARELAEAIARILPRLSQIQANAGLQADIFAREHSGDAYVDVLLSLLQSNARHSTDGPNDNVFRIAPPDMVSNEPISS